MPVPVPAGALPAAHRVCCVRCLRKMKSDPDHDCDFSKKSSKKCAYCTQQNAVCNPVRCYTKVLRNLSDLANTHSCLGLWEKSSLLFKEQWGLVRSGLPQRRWMKFSWWPMRRHQRTWHPARWLSWRRPGSCGPKLGCYGRSKRRRWRRIGPLGPRRGSGWR